MSRIIMVAPLSSLRLLGLSLRLIAIKTLAILISNALLRFMFDDLRLQGDEHPIISFLNTYVFPYLHYPLWLGGIDIFNERSHILTGTATLLLVILIWPLTLLGQYGGRVIYEYNEKLANGGAITGHPQRTWFLTTSILLVGAVYWRLWGDAGSTDIPRDFYLLLRLTFIYAAGIGALTCLYVGYSLHNYHRRLNPKIPQTKLKAAPKLRVVHSAGKPQTSSARPSGQRALLVALVAELIQFCGQHDRLPTAAELAGRLGPLLRAALVTGSSMPGPGELENICAQTLDLLNQGKLAPLTGLKEARKLFQKPGKGSVDKIVSQLEKNLNA
jgi:hypothetical protein